MHRPRPTGSATKCFLEVSADSLMKETGSKELCIFPRAKLKGTTRKTEVWYKCLDISAELKKALRA